jgi:hypothetical protein
MTQPQTLNATMALALNMINSIFPDLPATCRQNAISNSKIEKGDATWAYHKCILGWDINTLAYTIHPPMHHYMNYVIS